MYPKLTNTEIEESYLAAKKTFARLGVDTDQAIEAASKVPVSVHCWQGDDVAGFEKSSDQLTGGIMATGNHPGRAQTPAQLRADLDKALSLIPGAKKVNVHAIYAETGGKKVERDQLGPEHFSNWIDWAVKKGIGLDFNPSYFSHPKADSGATLSHADDEVRAFWVRHGIQSRRIAEAMGKATGVRCVNNIWIPDGSKDLPADRLSPRKRLRESLDSILAEKLDPKALEDAVECKLFGIGSESYVVGSHEFYTAYACQKQMALCLDMGHFHPTETIHDKISSLLPFIPGILLHISRGIRWDSDHVVIYNDDVQAVFNEIKRTDSWAKVNVALDFFDASINRIQAWTIGSRAVRKAILAAVLEPSQLIGDAERSGRLGSRLALMEEVKNLPLQAVWDKLCLVNKVPVGMAWIEDAEDYEKTVLLKR